MFALNVWNGRPLLPHGSQDRARLQCRTGATCSVWVQLGHCNRVTVELQHVLICIWYIRWQFLVCTGDIIKVRRMSRFQVVTRANMRHRKASVLEVLNWNVDLARMLSAWLFCKPWCVWCFLWHFHAFSLLPKTISLSSPNVVPDRQQRNEWNMKRVVQGVGRSLLRKMNVKKDRTPVGLTTNWTSMVWVQQYNSEAYRHETWHTSRDFFNLPTWYSLFFLHTYCWGFLNKCYLPRLRPTRQLILHISHEPIYKRCESCCRDEFDIGNAMRAEPATKLFFNLSLTPTLSPSDVLTLGLILPDVEDKFAAAAWHIVSIYKWGFNLGGWNCPRVLRSDCYHSALHQSV